MKVKVKSCLTLCDPVDCSLPGSSVHEIFQTRVLEWVAIFFSRGSSKPRDRTRISCTAGRCFTIWATREPNIYVCVCVCVYIYTHIYTCIYIYIFTIVQKNTWIPFKILKFYFSFFLKENNQLFFTSFSVGCLHWFFHHIYSFLNYQPEKGKGEAKGKIPQQLIALVAQSCLTLTPHGL